MIKRLLFLLTAISILVGSSVVSFASTAPNWNNINNVKISLTGVSEDIKQFFVDFKDTPSDRRLLIGIYYPSNNSVSYRIFILNNPINSLVTVPQNPVSSSFIFEIPSSQFVGGFRYIQIYSSTTPIAYPNPTFFVKPTGIYTTSPLLGTFGASFIDTTFSSFSIDTTQSKPSWNWEKTTSLDFVFDDSPYPPPPEPPKPPKPPVIDDEYIPYDPDSWEDFFDKVSNAIGVATNIGFKVFGLLFGIYLIIKIVNHYKR